MRRPAYLTCEIKVAAERGALHQLLNTPPGLGCQLIRIGFFMTAHAPTTRSSHAMRIAMNFQKRRTADRKICDLAPSRKSQFLQRTAAPPAPRSDSAQHRSARPL